MRQLSEYCWPLQLGPLLLSFLSPLFTQKHLSGNLWWVTVRVTGAGQPTELGLVSSGPGVGESCPVPAADLVPAAWSLHHNSPLWYKWFCSIGFNPIFRLESRDSWLLLFNCPIRNEAYLVWSPSRVLWLILLILMLLITSKKLEDYWVIAFNIQL